MSTDPDRADPADSTDIGVAFPWRTPEGVERVAYLAASPLPYYPQDRPAWWKRVAVFTALRRYRCRGRWWCSWPATERAGRCDRHPEEPR